MRFPRAPVGQRPLPPLLCVLMLLLCILGPAGGLLSAPPAAAKGARSAVLISASTDKTVVLTEAEADIRTPAAPLPPWRDGNALGPPPTEKAAGPDTGRQLTVMWRGGHDTVFSVDAVLPLYDGTSAWVRKEDNLLGGTPRGRWFPAEPALLPFLDRLGLYDERAHPRPTAAQPTPEVAADAQSGSGTGSGAGASSASVPASTSAPAGAYWWWAGPGLAAGILLGVLGTPWLGRRRPAPGRTGPLRDGPSRPPDRSPTA